MINSQSHIDILPVSECLQLNLSIPEYQRPYKWSVSSIDTMLWDINDAIQQRLIFSDYKYRIGTIILHKSDQKLDVVDGQQRLISLTLISKYLDKGYKNTLKVSMSCSENTHVFLRQNYPKTYPRQLCSYT